MGCGRSVHRFPAIAQTADVTMDFTHDVLLHPFADVAVLGTHEQSVFYQTAKLRAFLAYNANDLIFEEKIRIGGIFHIRGDSYVFHIFTVGMIITVAVWVGASALCSFNTEKICAG